MYYCKYINPANAELPTAGVEVSKSFKLKTVPRINISAGLRN